VAGGTVCPEIKKNYQNIRLIFVFIMFNFQSPYGMQGQVIGTKMYLLIYTIVFNQ